VQAPRGIAKQGRRNAASQAIPAWACVQQRQLRVKWGQKVQISIKYDRATAHWLGLDSMTTLS